jgi:hypothetical protein
MSPEVKELLLKNFQLVATFGTFVTWLAFKDSSLGLLKWGRRLSLAGFLYFLLDYFKKITPKVIARLDVMDADVYFRRNFAMNKGTDWVDGFFWGISISIFAGIVAALLGMELKKKKK